MDDLNSFLIKYRQSGERKWFEKIYYFFMPKIFNYFYYRTTDKQLSEDLASEVFLKVYGNLKTKKFNSRSFNVWIYKIARNQLIDHIRKTKIINGNTLLTDWQEHEYLNDKNLIENDYLINNSILLKKEFAFEDVRLIEAIKKLTKLQKNVLLLIFVMDFDYVTVAKLLAKKNSTIRGIVFRAIKILKNEIQND